MSSMIEKATAALGQPERHSLTTGEGLSYVGAIVFCLDLLSRILNHNTVTTDQLMEMVKSSQDIAQVLAFAQTQVRTWLDVAEAGGLMGLIAFLAKSYASDRRDIKTARIKASAPEKGGARGAIPRSPK